MHFCKKYRHLELNCTILSIVKKKESLQCFSKTSSTFSVFLFRNRFLHTVLYLDRNGTNIRLLPDAKQQYHDNNLKWFVHFTYELDKKSFQYLYPCAFLVVSGKSRRPRERRRRRSHKGSQETGSASLRWVPFFDRFVLFFFFLVPSLCSLLLSFKLPHSTCCGLKA